MPQCRRNLIYLTYIFQEVNCCSQRFRQSFFPDAIWSWNNILSQFENLHTFGIHDPLKIRSIFQLRVGLRSHKKRHNFIDNLIETCMCKQVVENTRHFLLHCPFHATHREILFKCANDILGNHPSLLINEIVQLYGMHLKVLHSDLMKLCQFWLMKSIYIRYVMKRWNSLVTYGHKCVGWYH